MVLGVGMATIKTVSTVMCEASSLFSLFTIQVKLSGYLTELTNQSSDHVPRLIPSSYACSRPSQQRGVHAAIVRWSNVRARARGMFCMRRSDAHPNTCHNIRVFGLETSRGRQKNINIILFVKSNKNVRLERVARGSGRRRCGRKLAAW